MYGSNTQSAGGPSSFRPNALSSRRPNKPANTTTPFPSTTAQPSNLFNPRNASTNPTTAPQKRPPPPQPRDDDLDQLTEEQREDILESFNLFDLDKDSHLDYHELKVAMKALGFQPNKPELANILQEYGTPVQGGQKLVISQEGFLRAMAPRVYRRDPQEEMEKAFRLFTGNRDGGGITVNDLRRVAQELGEGLEEEELRAMIEEFDVDGDGEIGREEFYGICRGE
ncbi:EF-hand [Ascobolus immersus RN42]|uniref:Calmodulin n=1 Tax=Ascobolus immersus RN42 TaxID=1160509 RepID=A0A3N4HUN8_ASCIM|nr:EF-hand [Ascobolus immersus RN42]